DAGAEVGADRLRNREQRPRAPDAVRGADGSGAWPRRAHDQSVEVVSHDSGRIDRDIGCGVGAELAPPVNIGWLVSGGRSLLRPYERICPPWPDCLGQRHNILKISSDKQRATSAPLLVVCGWHAVGWRSKQRMAGRAIIP